MVRGLNHGLCIQFVDHLENLEPPSMEGLDSLAIVRQTLLFVSSAWSLIYC